MQKACSPAVLPSAKQKYCSVHVLILLISLLIECSSVTTSLLRMCPCAACLPCLMFVYIDFSWRAKPVLNPYFPAFYHHSFVWFFLHLSRSTEESFLFIAWKPPLTKNLKGKEARLLLFAEVKDGSRGSVWSEFVQGSTSHQAVLSCWVCAFCVLPPLWIALCNLKE